MKLLRQFDSKAEAKDFAWKLLNNGIAVQLSGLASFNHKVITGTTKIGVWLLVDDQYQDALSVINNESAKVLNRVPNSQIEELKVNLDQDYVSLNISKSVWDKIIVFSLILIGLLLFLAFMAIN